MIQYAVCVVLCMVLVLRVVLHALAAHSLIAKKHPQLIGKIRATKYRMIRAPIHTILVIRSFPSSILFNSQPYTGMYLSFLRPSSTPAFDPTYFRRQL